MAKKIKVTYNDGTDEDFLVSTPKEQQQQEQDILNEIPDDLLKMFGLSKKRLLNSLPPLDSEDEEE